MIEMLGVLAIIGVLSVGGIAGYTKAIKMYRSNLFRKQLGQIISTYIEVRPHFDKKAPLQNYTYVLDALNAVPDGLTYLGVPAGAVYANNILQDTYKNSFLMYYGLKDQKLEAQIYILFFKSRTLWTLSAQEYCIDAILVAKQFEKNIDSMLLTGKKNQWVNFKTASLATIHKQCSSFCDFEHNNGCGVYLFPNP